MAVLLHNVFAQDSMTSSDSNGMTTNHKKAKERAHQETQRFALRLEQNVQMSKHKPQC